MARRDRSHEIFLRDEVLYGPRSGRISSKRQRCQFTGHPHAPRTSYITVSMAPASYLLNPSSVITGPSIQKYFFGGLGHHGYVENNERLKIQYRRCRPYRHIYSFSFSSMQRYSTYPLASHVPFATSFPSHISIRLRTSVHLVIDRVANLLYAG